MYSEYSLLIILQEVDGRNKTTRNPKERLDFEEIFPGAKSYFFVVIVNPLKLAMHAHLATPGYEFNSLLTNNKIINFIKNIIISRFLFFSMTNSCGMWTS